MRPTQKVLLAASLATLSFTLSSPAAAQCVATPMGGFDDVECTGVDADGYTGTTGNDQIVVRTGADIDNDSGDAISGADGNDTITVEGGTIDGHHDAVHGGLGGDTILISGGTLTAPNDDGVDGGDSGDGDDMITMTGGSIDAWDTGIEGDDGNDTILVSGGSITSVGDGIDGEEDNDTITITGGTVNSDTEDAIDAGPGDDTVSLSNTTITTGGTTGDNDYAVDADDGNDRVIIGDGVVINGEMAGRDGTDTLVFAMQVSAGNIASVRAAIAAADPAGDSLTIEGQTYTWTTFETITDNVRSQGPTNNATGTVAVPTIPLYGLAFTIVGLLLVAVRRLRR